jgi:hypothetical protein
MKTQVTKDDLIGLLGEHSDRDLLVIMMAQVLDAKAEIRMLQVTVNTLLIELCHRQPEKLSENLLRMSGQHYQEILAQFRKRSDAFGQPAVTELPSL